jgi:hypothetical protein
MVLLANAGLSRQNGPRPAPPIGGPRPRTIFFGVDRATLGMTKLVGQYVAELAANLAFHLVGLTAIVCRNHDIQQIEPPFSDSPANHFRCLGVKEHLFCTLA